MGGKPYTPAAVRRMSYIFRNEIIVVDKRHNEESRVRTRDLVDKVLHLSHCKIVEARTHLKSGGYEDLFFRQNIRNKTTKPKALLINLAIDMKIIKSLFLNLIIVNHQ